VEGSSLYGEVLAAGSDDSFDFGEIVDFEVVGVLRDSVAVKG